MSRYLLSTYMVEGEVPGAPDPGEMQAFMQRVMALEEEMSQAGAFVFGGALDGPAAATVVRPGHDGTSTRTDGSLAAGTTHVAGFYIIDADDLDAALAWGDKVAAATNHPIEVRPFRATGKLKDHMPGG